LRLTIKNKNPNGTTKPETNVLIIFIIATKYV
jgi:hypothetical protein